MKKFNFTSNLCRLAVVLVLIFGTTVLDSCSRHSKKDDFLNSQRELVAWMQKPSTINDIKNIIQQNGAGYEMKVNEYMTQNRFAILKRHNLTPKESDSLAGVLMRDKDYMKFMDSVKVIMPKIMAAFNDLAPKPAPGADQGGAPADQNPQAAPAPNASQAPSGASGKNAPAAAPAPAGKPGRPAPAPKN